MKYKHQQQKSLFQTGIVVALAVAFSALAGGLAQNSEAYATENLIDEQADVVLLAEEEDLTEEEARQAAEKLVTTIKRLEVTPKYQELTGLLQALNCIAYDDTLPYNFYGCEKKTSWEDFRRELRKLVPEDKWDEIPEDADELAAEQLVPYFTQWRSVDSGIKEVYDALRVWQNVDGSGITAELTVENVTKAMLKTKSTIALRGDFALTSFWEALWILQADTLTGKLARLHSQLMDTYWMELVGMTYLAEQYPAVWYYDSELANLLAYYVGESAYGIPTDDKIALARGLSDWGQAKTLFDALGTACGELSEEGFAWFWNCYETLVELDESTLAELYEKAENAATILYPDVMRGMWDYKLVLAELPGAQKAPNSGILGFDKGEMSDLAMVVVMTCGGVAAVLGALVVVRLWTHKKF